MSYGEVKKVSSFRLSTEALGHIGEIVKLDEPPRYGWGNLSKTEAIERALKHYAGVVRGRKKDSGESPPAEEPPQEGEDSDFVPY